jgi:hypothetical protein
MLRALPILLGLLCAGCIPATEAPEPHDAQPHDGTAAAQTAVAGVRSRPFTWPDRPPPPTKPCPDLARRLERFVAAEPERRGYHEDALVECEGAGPPVLELARGTRDARLRATLIYVLGFMKYVEAAPFLEERLSADPDTAVRSAAAYALAYLQRPESAGALSRAVQSDPDAGVVAQAAMAIATSRAPNGLPALRLALSRDLVRRNASTRMWVLQAIGGVGYDSDVCVLALYLYDEDWSVAQRAAESIEEITGEDFGIPDGGGIGSPMTGVREARVWWEAKRALYRCK